MLRIVSPLQVSEESIEIDGHTLSAKISGNYSSHHWFHYSQRGLLEIGLGSRNQSPEDITLVTWVAQQIKFGSPYSLHELDVLKIKGSPSFDIAVNAEPPTYTDIDEDFTVWIDKTQISILVGTKEKLSIIFVGQRVHIGINSKGHMQLIQFADLAEDELDRVRDLVENKAIEP